MRGADQRGRAPSPLHRSLREGAYRTGLKIQLHPNGTAIEGEWQPVFQAIETCHKAVHAIPRCSQRTAFCPPSCNRNIVN